MKKLPVLVLGLYLPGMSLLRNYSKRNIKVFGADCEKSVYGFITKFGKKFYCPDPKVNEEEWLNNIIKFAKNVGEEIVLISTSDRFLIPISKNRNELCKYFRFNIPEHSILEKLFSKRRLYNLALENGISVPKTIFSDSVEELEKLLNKLKFPVVMKPEYSKDWFRKDIANFVKSQKVLVLKNVEEILRVCKIMKKFEVPVLIQELIPGKDENLFYVVSYSTREGKILTSFIGKKNRITPIHFGSGSYVEIVENEALVHISRQFLNSIEYRGICGLEFKLDQDTNEYKLVEINPRFGLWDEIGKKMGKDIGYLYYKEMIGYDLKDFIEPPFKKYYWISLHRDVAAFFEYKENQEIKYIDWFKTLFREPIFFSDLYLDDFRVTIYTIYRVFRKILSRMLKVIKVKIK